MLVEYASTRDVALRNRIVLANVGIVHSVVRAFFGIAKRSTRPDEDLTSAGMIGLTEAIDRFDPKRNVTLYIHAKSWVLYRVQEEYYRLQGSRRHKTGFQKSTPYDAGLLLQGCIGEGRDSHEAIVVASLDSERLHAHFTADEIDVLLSWADFQRETDAVRRERLNPVQAVERWRATPRPVGVASIRDLRRVVAPLLLRAAALYRREGGGR